MLTCLEEIVAHTHNSCICLILICCVSYLCALMLINISSCMLGWLHLALPIASSCTFLEFKHCKGRYSKRSEQRCSEQRPSYLMQNWKIKCIRFDAFWMGTVRALYRSAVRTAPLSDPRGQFMGAVQELYRSALRTAPKANLRQTYQNDHTLIWPPIYMPLWL